MTDHLTNLQDSFDQLATQMFASLRYISAHHSLAPIANQPFHGWPEPASTANHAHAPSADAPPQEETTQPLQNQSMDQNQDRPPQQDQTQTQTQTQPETQTQTQAEDFDPNEPPRPDTPRTFAAALEELAQDLVTKEQQIERLIGSLPGRGRSLEEQEERLRELDAELRGVEGEVAEARREREELTARVEEVMWRVRRW